MQCDCAFHLSADGAGRWHVMVSYSGYSATAGKNTIYLKDLMSLNLRISIFFLMRTHSIKSTFRNVKIREVRCDGRHEPVARRRPELRQHPPCLQWAGSAKQALARAKWNFRMALASDYGPRSAPYERGRELIKVLGQGTLNNPERRWCCNVLTKMLALTLTAGKCVFAGGGGGLIEKHTLPACECKQNQPMGQF